VTVAAEHAAGVATTTSGFSRLLVTRRDPETTTYHPLGFLTFDSTEYTFSYLRRALVEGFHPLPGLSDTTHAHTSDRLFPIFAERVISARRPDRQTSMEALGLDVDAAPFEVLARSGGRRVGDTIEVVPAPEAAPDGSLTVDFLAHGVRYQPPTAQERITRLRRGEQLHIVHQTDNVSDPRALLVTDRDEIPLGYVPNPLLDLVHALADRTASVVRANGPDVGFHFRLLARVAGRVEGGYQPFEGPDWETVD
jgi:hypothetical protein